MADSVGFEPTELSFKSFQDFHLKPLGQLSMLKFKLVTHPRLELGTHGLKIRYSTN